MTDRRSLRKLRYAVPVCCLLAMLTAGNAAAQTNSSEPSKPITSATLAPSLPERLTGVPSASMPDVVADAVKDFRHIPSWTNLAIFAAAGIGAGLEHPSDVTVSHAMSGSPALGSFFRVGETVGG